MATQKRDGTHKGKRWNYFYLNGELHKTIETKRADNMLIAWNYKHNKRVSYILSDAYKYRKRAYSASQVAKMINRHVDTLKRHMRSGEVRKPQAAYALNGDGDRFRYLFSEDDIREIHDFFRTVHRGRPRQDGLVTSSDLPSRPELEALMRNEKILYTKSDDGQFVPVWKQPEW